MALSAREIVQLIRNLQDAATLCANRFSTTKTQVEYRIAFSAGAALPWRMLEVHLPRSRKDRRYVLRRMHCFRTPEDLMRSVRERVNWKARDQQLVASYLGKGHSASGEPSERASESPSAAYPTRSSNLRDLTPARLELREQMCVTRPERVIDLLHS